MEAVDSTVATPIADALPTALGIPSEEMPKKKRLGLGAWLSIIWLAVITLSAILARLASHYATVCPDDDPHDHLAYARIALWAGDFDR